MTTYVQETLFGVPETIVIEQERRYTQEEINEYYKTHTLTETAKRFHSRRERLPISPALKKGRRGAGKRPSLETEVKAVFLKLFTKLSNQHIGRLCGVDGHTVVAIERRNQSLKDLFEEFDTPHD